MWKEEELTRLRSSWKGGIRVIRCSVALGQNPNIRLVLGETVRWGKTNKTILQKREQKPLQIPT